MRAETAPALRRVAGQPATIPEGTIAELFLEAVERHDKPDAFKAKRAGVWESWSHRRIAGEVKRLALGLSALGLRRGDRVALLSENRPEWHLADFASVMRGLLTVPVYPSLPADQIEFMVRDSSARAIFVSTAEQLEKAHLLKRSCSSLELVIAFDPPERGAPYLRTLAEVAALGDAEIAAGRDAEYPELALSTRPHDLLTILYTSGTTGEPKGVMLTHHNLVSNVRSVLQVLPVGRGDVALSFLPLSHIFERMVGYTFFYAGITIAYCESHRLLREMMPEVRPTVMTAVPHVYGRIHQAVHEKAMSGGAGRRRIFMWAKRVAAEWTERRLAGRRVGAGLALRHAIADRLVYRKLRALTGGRMRFFISGGAALGEELAKFFYGFGLLILEGYGLTETSPVIACNRPTDFRFGTVGRPIPGVEVAIAEDGEILTRGPHVMKGYYKRPGETAAVIDAEGWFHTGDLGELDPDGYLRITDRKKEILVTAGGKNIAPRAIEERVVRSPWVAEAVLIADGRPYPVLLVVPDFVRLERWARERGILGDRAELVANREVSAFLEEQILGPLSGLASFERPKKLGLVPEELSIESGLLTPTLKVKRRVIEERYRSIIEALYAR